MEQYAFLAQQLRAMITGEPDFLANAANLTALVYHGLPRLNWVGFYWLKEKDLVLGPFQGRPACTRIPLGHGVCGTAAAARKTLVVPDVDAFSGHIACDSASRSEIVIPLETTHQLIGVFDVDSTIESRFDERDKGGLELLIKVFLDETGNRGPSQPFSV